MTVHNVSTDDATHPTSTRLPPAVDIDTATVNKTYTTSEVIEDATLFGDWVVPGTWVYAPDTDWVYRLDPGTPPFTFELTPGTQLHPNSTGSATPPENAHHNRVTDIQSVSELSGELLAGRLRGFTPGTTSQLTDALTVTNTGEYLLFTTTTTDAQTVRDVSIPTHRVPERFTDGSPESVLTPATEQEIITATRNPNTTTIAYTVHGTRAGIMHLINTPGAGNADPSPTTPESITEQGPQPVSTISDGGAVPGTGTVGVDSRIDSVPYFPSEDPEMVARFVPTSRHVAETFQEPNLRRYALNYMDGRVLNACAGPTRLAKWYDDGDIIRNDLHPEIDSDLSVDIAELACHFEPESFDTIVFDPPWTTYQSRMRYDGYVVHKTPDDELPVNQINIDVRELPFTVPGEHAVASHPMGEQTTLTSPSVQPATSETGTAESDGDETRDKYVDAETPKDQLGHARLAKLGFDYLLKDGGRVIQFAYTGSVMPAALGYTRLDRTAFDPTGTYKTLIAGVDVKD